MSARICVQHTPCTHLISTVVVERVSKDHEVEIKNGFKNLLKIVDTQCSYLLF